MNIEQLAEKIDKKFDKFEGTMSRFDDKLDNYSERVVRVEEKYNSISGQVKIVFTLIGAVMSGIITWITTRFT